MAQLSSDYLGKVDSHGGDDFRGGGFGSDDLRGGYFGVDDFRGGCFGVDDFWGGGFGSANRLWSRYSIAP